jgi:hypothetical protein
MFVMCTREDGRLLTQIEYVLYEKRRTQAGNSAVRAPARVINCGLAATPHTVLKICVHGNCQYTRRFPSACTGPVHRDCSQWRCL